MNAARPHRRSRKHRSPGRRARKPFAGRIIPLFTALLLLLAVRLFGPNVLTPLPSEAPTPLPAEEAPASLPDESGSIRVDFLDVGQGLSVLVEADGTFLLYDGGDREASSFVVAFLKERGVEALDYTIASHYDADHINGLVGALHAFETKLILGPDYTADSRVYQSLCSRIQELDNNILTPEPGSRYPLGQGYFEVLAPLSDVYSDVNNYSLVIRIVYGENSFLLTGDAEAESEAELLGYREHLQSDILCVGHHGSPSSTGESFLELVQPSHAVISCGEGNSYGHPDPSVLERFEQRRIPVWRTDESGTITILGDGESLRITSERAVSPLLSE